MISIIISTYRKDYMKALQKNIEETIGSIPYEIIEIYNPEKTGIAKVYNKAANSAGSDHLLFLHEDVQFLTHNWGLELLKGFKLPQAGILGLAGNQQKTSLPTGHDLGIDKYRKVFIAHSQSELGKIKSSGVPQPVKTLDGVFLSMRKNLWQQLKFDESNNSFHFYDLDISLRASRDYQNYVVPGIQLIHFSRGNFGDEWVESCLEFHKRNNLCQLDSPSVPDKNRIRKFWYRRLTYEDISFYNRLRYLKRMGVDYQSVNSALKFLLLKVFNNPPV